MPDDTPNSPAPSSAPPGQGPGSVPSGGPTAGAGAGQVPGVTPPMSAPASQAIAPQGAITAAQNAVSDALGKLKTALIAYHPSQDEWKAISESMGKLAKHFPLQPQRPMIPNAPMAGGGAPRPPMAPMSGGPLNAGTQRGPIPTPGGGGMGGMM